MYTSSTTTGSNELNGVGGPVAMIQHLFPEKVFVVSSVVEGAKRPYVYRTSAQDLPCELLVAAIQPIEK